MTGEDLRALALALAGTLAAARMVYVFFRPTPTPTPTPTPATSPAAGAGGLSLTLTLENPLTFSFPVGTIVPAKLNPLNAAGEPGASLPAPPTWSTSNPAVFTVVATAPDGSAAALTGVAPGVATLHAASGPLAYVCEIRVTSGPAASLTVDFGDPFTPEPG